MSDGSLLLKSVMKHRAREESANGAFVDYLQENLPNPGETFEVRCRFRIRYGVVIVKYVQWKSDYPSHYKIESFHSRGNRGTRGRSVYVGTNDPAFSVCMAKALLTFRS